MLQKAAETGYININCADPLGRYIYISPILDRNEYNNKVSRIMPFFFFFPTSLRSALLMAIDNENLEMVELLLEYRVETKDALLHAISEEYVEAVEVSLVYLLRQTCPFCISTIINRFCWSMKTLSGRLGILMYVWKFTTLLLICSSFLFIL
jgi:hypothetical protein